MKDSSLKKFGNITLFFAIIFGPPSLYAKEPEIHIGKINKFHFKSNQPIILKTEDGNTIKLLKKNFSKDLTPPIPISKFDKKKRKVYFHHAGISKLVAINRRDVDVEFLDKPIVVDPSVCEEVQMAASDGTASRMSSNDLKSILATCN